MWEGEGGAIQTKAVSILSLKYCSVVGILHDGSKAPCVCVCVWLGREQARESLGDLLLPLRSSTLDGRQVFVVPQL